LWNEHQFSIPSWAITTVVIVAKCKNLDGVKCFKYEESLEWSYKVDKTTFPGMGQELFIMILYSILYRMILLLIDYGKECRRTKGRGNFVRSVNDSDVTAEVERVKMPPSVDGAVDALVVDGLCKAYGSFAAVNNMTFGVEKGECLGLLGVNRAGKTTTFKVLTGEENPSQGTARMFNKIDPLKSKP